MRGCAVRGRVGSSQRPLAGHPEPGRFRLQHRSPASETARHDDVAAEIRSRRRRVGRADAPQQHLKRHARQRTPLFIAAKNIVGGAIVETLPLGSVGYEPALKGERLIWVEAAVADRLMAARRPGESYSDVILRSCGWSRSRRRAGAVSHSLTVLGFSPEITAWPGSSPGDDTAKVDRAIRGARRRDPRQAVVAGGSGRVG